MAAYTSHFTILRATSWHHGASDLIHFTCSIHFHSSPFCDTLPTLPRQVKQARGLGSDFPRARTPGCMQPSSGVESSRLSLCAQPSCHRARGVCDEAMGICVPPCADVRREFPVSLGHPLEHPVELLAISSSCSSSQHASSLWGLFLPTMQRRHWLDASYDA